MRPTSRAVAAWQRGAGGLVGMAAEHLHRRSCRVGRGASRRVRKPDIQRALGRGWLHHRLRGVYRCGPLATCAGYRGHTPPPHRQSITAHPARSGFPADNSIPLDYAGTLSQLQGLIGGRIRVGFAHWPDSDPIFGYATGYLRVATPGWTLNSANPDDALGFTLTRAPEGTDTIGGFVISRQYFHDAQTYPNGAISLHIDDLAIAITPDRPRA
jgi:hypothetical protein